jgi:hypothetical protein
MAKQISRDRISSCRNAFVELLKTFNRDQVAQMAQDVRPFFTVAEWRNCDFFTSGPKPDFYDCFF